MSNLRINLSTGEQVNLINERVLINETYTLQIISKLNTYDGYGCDRIVDLTDEADTIKALLYGYEVAYIDDEYTHYMDSHSGVIMSRHNMTGDTHIWGSLERWSGMTHSSCRVHKWTCTAPKKGK